MLQEDTMTDALRSLAAELDELGNEDSGRPSPPPEIPDFRITDVLGRGGMGTVYLAEQISLGREVALKVVHDPAFADIPQPEAVREADALAGVRPPYHPSQSVGRADPCPPSDEARTVAQLHHPNIVQVYAAGTNGGQPWFAMELMRGKTASEGEFASAADVARIGVQIAEALSYAHRCGVIHRDVKPSNIFIGENGLAKLGDFGLANSTGDGGTHRYMAPELLNDGKASEASDQYALGVTLQELVGRADLCPPLVPTDFEAICAKAMSQDPASRYESMDAMIDDLRRFLAHKPVAANPPSLFRRFRLFAGRNPLAASGIVAASLLLAAFVAALAVGYVKTSRALAATEREAASAAQSLAKVVAEIDRTDSDKRDAEITRALTAAEHLAERFPENADIAEAVAKLKHAREAHARFKERRGGEMRLQNRFRPEPRPLPRRKP